MLTWEQAVLWLRLQPEHRELVLASYYDDSVQTAAERYYQSEEWRAARGLLGLDAPFKVLDIGAGRGISSYAFAREGCEVTALEPDGSDIVGAGAIRELARASGLQINVVEACGETLPFADAAFDIVYGRAVLHHAKDLGSLCREASRVLKPGGKFFAGREHVISKESDLGAFLDAHPLHKLYGGEHAFMLSEYAAAIRAAGLELKRELGPFDSPINYAPLSSLELKDTVCRSIRFKAARDIAAVLLDSKVILSLYLRYLTLRSDSPGRLYSFLAVKKARRS